MKKFITYWHSPSGWKSMLAVLTGAVVFEYWRINNPIATLTIFGSGVSEMLAEMGIPVFVRFSILELPTMIIGAAIGFFIYRAAVGPGLDWLPGALAAFLGLTFTLEWVAFETGLQGLGAVILYVIGTAAGYGFYNLLKGASTAQPRDTKMLLGAIVTGGAFGYFAVLNSNIIFYAVGLFATPFVFAQGFLAEGSFLRIIDLDFAFAVVLGAIGGFWALRSVQAGVKTQPVDGSSSGISA